MHKDKTNVQPHKIFSVKLHPIAPWKWGLWITFIFSVNGILFASLVFFYWKLTSQYGPAIGWIYTLKIFGLSLLVFLISIILTLINVQRSNQLLAIYQEGIIVKQSKLRKISWKSINKFEAVREEHYFLWFCIKKVWVFIFQLTNGKIIKTRIPRDIPEKFILDTRSAYQLSRLITETME